MGENDKVRSLQAGGGHPVILYRTLSTKAKIQAILAGTFCAARAESVFESEGGLDNGALSRTSMLCYVYPIPDLMHVMFCVSAKSGG